MLHTSNTTTRQACRYVAVDKNDPVAVAKAHEAIAKEYAWNGRRRRTLRSHGPANYVRPHDLERLYEDRYGARELPDDDSGSGDLFIMAHHLANIRAR